MDASPGTIVKTFEVPEKLRKIQPFYVRRQPEYQPLFDEIWHHFDGRTGRKEPSDVEKNDR